MVQVQISYNAYQESMSIHIDDCPLPPISSLSRFQTMPFGFWCDKIFPAIAQEVNDRYSVVYVGRTCESRILGRFMGAVPVCASYSNRQPELADPALTRLKKLSSLCQSGVSVERFSVPLYLYTDRPEYAEALAKECLPKLAYCRINPKIQPLQAFSSHPGDQPAFVLTAQEPPVLSNRAGVCVLSSAPGDTAITCRDNCFTERVREQEQADRLRDYLELLLYPHVLQKAISAVTVSKDSPLFLSVAVLDKTQPQTIVTLPASVEFGTTAPVKVRTVPEGAPAAKLNYRISDETVVRMTNQGLQAVGTGEAVVEVYISGQTTKLTSGKVTAYRRNRIRQLEIKQSDLKINVGDRVTLQYSFEPKDADNESAIRLLSSDGTVAAPEHGTTFVGRNPGNCRIVMQAEQVTADVRVQVYPRLEKLTLSMETGKIRVGDIVPLEVTRSPEDATLDKLVYTVTPERLGIYDVSTRSFFPKNTGTGTLTVSTQSGRVKCTVPIEVKAAKKKGLLGWIFS